MYHDYYKIARLGKLLALTEEAANKGETEFLAGVDYIMRSGKIHPSKDYVLPQFRKPDDDYVSPEAARECNNYIRSLMDELPYNVQVEIMGDLPRLLRSESESDYAKRIMKQLLRVWTYEMGAEVPKGKLESLWW